MWAKVNGMDVHICGSFTDKENACKFCKHFNLWGVNTGYCVPLDDDVSCNDTCEDFEELENIE